MTTPSAGSAMVTLSRPSQCLLCSFVQTSGRAATRSRRQFHSSPAQLERKKPRSRHANIKAADMPAAFQPKSLQKPYTAEEIADLEKKYTPAQMEAIKIGEDDITLKALQRAPRRVDPWSLDYFDDLSEVHPVVDKAIRAPASNTDANLRLKTEDELADDVVKFMEDMPEDAKSDDSAWMKWHQNLRVTVGKPEAELNPRSAVAPELITPQSVQTKKKKGNSDAREEEEASPALLRLMQMTGYTRRQLQMLRVKSIISHSVVNQTRMGKIRKAYFLSIAGNGKGSVGIGEGKAEEPVEARLQSQYRAIRNMQPIKRYERRTIFGDVKGKVSATELELYARPPGKQLPFTSALNSRTDSLPYRIRTSMPAIHLGDMQLCRDNRSRCASDEVKEPDEYSQGYDSGSAKSEGSGRYCKGERKEDGGCEESVLCRRLGLQHAKRGKVRKTKGRTRDLLSIALYHNVQVEHDSTCVYIYSDAPGTRYC